jgi:hypothetical protein
MAVMARWAGSGTSFSRKGDVVEAWMFDMGGHIVMVETRWRTDSPEEDLAELGAVIDTLVLTPKGRHADLVASDHPVPRLGKRSKSRCNPFPNAS